MNVIHAINKVQVTFEDSMQTPALENFCNFNGANEKCLVDITVIFEGHETLSSC